ncbi:MAG: LacI family DNA-binding transcriptional regulator [Acholeplasmatales bacterium]|jgi:LacI family transcriptional regulator|nr:LacI family DNA-binding transcriptional regulator [Acholeplasmatales bacterium]
MANKTIYDVAALAGVSLATVSRVINNPEVVKEKTKNRVLKAIKELGYKPNVIARNLATSKTTTVGVLVSDVTRSNISELLGGIIDIAKKYKYSIKLFAVDYNKPFIETVLEVVSEQVNGLLCLDDELSDTEVGLIKEWLSKNRIPFVFGNSYYEDPEIPSVTVDFEKASYEITKILAEDNRKNIYFLSTKRRYSVNMAKEKGYLRACNEFKIVPKVFVTTGDVLTSKEHFNEFFENKKKVDAAIGVRDSIAVNFLNVAKKYGKQIPQDIAVVGFQNSKYTLLSSPTLTTLDVPIYDIGAVSMRLLTKLMDGESLENIKIVLPHAIIERESTR